MENQLWKVECRLVHPHIHPSISTLPFIDSRLLHSSFTIHPFIIASLPAYPTVNATLARVGPQSTISVPPAGVS
jgi:hypothetical protein